MSSINVIKNALISVSDKNNILSIAQTLNQNNIQIFSTGGTSALFKKNHISVTDISHYIDFPEIMDGRIKTLHPKILSGILRRPKQDKEIMQRHKIDSIDIVIINFYPFEKMNLLDKNFDSMMNFIDIGGPTLVRAAAKNYKNVIVIVDMSDFKSVWTSIKNNTMNVEKRFDLATKAFQYTLSYEQSIFQFFRDHNSFNTKETNLLFPKTINLSFIKKQDLRYGENQHQKASFYTEKKILPSGTISSSIQIQGKTLSYNNISDANIALECVKEFQDPACVIVKHENPCGAAVNKKILTSYVSAYQTDPISSFGGIVAFNKMIDEETAEEMIKKHFVEVLIAPKINNEALKILQKKTNLRILISGDIRYDKSNLLHYKSVTNGLLIQEYDSYKINDKKWRFVTDRIPTQNELKDAIFSCKIAKFVKSNAIVYSKNQKTISIGSGQTSRVDSTKLANMKAKCKLDQINQATMASDAFFPFKDSIEQAASIGVTCIVQPGGSIRDEEIIQSANKHNIAMIFTYKRHFKH